MTDQHIHIPAGGIAISVKNDKLIIPDTPIIPFIEGDGIGRDISTATRRILDAAVEKVYGGRRRIAWLEAYAGQKAARLYGHYLPQ